MGWLRSDGVQHDQAGVVAVQSPSDLTTGLGDHIVPSMGMFRFDQSSVKSKSHGSVF